MGEIRENHVQEVWGALSSRQLRQCKEKAGLLKKVRHGSYEKVGRLETR
jgi:hypothetical protein